MKNEQVIYALWEKKLKNIVTISEKFFALKKLGVGEFAYLNGNLESHLVGTYVLLSNWGNTNIVCDAGLYHVLYGTQPLEKFGLSSEKYLLSGRPSIKKTIGNEVENLVFLYGACDRDYFYPQIGSIEPIYRNRFTGVKSVLSLNITSELLEITTANELEICINNPAFLKKHEEWYIELFDRFKGFVSKNAYAHYLETFGHK